MASIAFHLTSGITSYGDQRKLRSAKHKISMELICEDQLIRVISTPVNNLYLLQEFIQIGFRFKHKFFA